jgi:putative oxidoreductase
VKVRRNDLKKLAKGPAVASFAPEETNKIDNRIAIVRTNRPRTAEILSIPPHRTPALTLSKARFVLFTSRDLIHDFRMNVLTVIARILLGLAFVIFGSNAFLRFLPMPPPPANLAGDFVKVFFASGYVYVVGGMQLIAGLMLLIGKFVPLGLTILAAIIFNILVFHALMAPEGFPPAIIVTLLEAFLIWRYRGSFAGILKP